MPVTVTWWGHATATVALGGLRVLTDPLLSDSLAHLVRQQVRRPGPAARVADVVIVSHLHADHLHLPSLALLPASCRLIGPTGIRALLADRAPALAARVEQVGPGDVLDLGGVSLAAVPAHHDGRRLPRSRYAGPALGFVLRMEERSVWFAGDTGLFAGLAGIGPVDVALVPVGGWGPTLGPHHLDPAQAAEAVARVGAHDAVPMHYGTFWPRGLRTMAPRQFIEKCLEPGDRFAAALAARGTARAHVLAPGDSVQL